jgi:hypothetical protein
MLMYGRCAVVRHVCMMHTRQVQGVLLLLNLLQYSQQSHLALLGTCCHTRLHFKSGNKPPYNTCVCALLLQAIACTTSPMVAGLKA